MRKLSLHQTIAVVLLVALNAFLAACGQPGGSSSATPVSNTAEGNTTVTVPSGDATTSDIVASDGTASGDVDTQATIISAMATATVLAGMQNSMPQAGLDLLSVDPCKLLTEDDVKSAIGDVPFAPRQLQQDSYHTGCSYVEPGFDGDKHRLTLGLDSLDMWEMRPANVLPVSGIGDAAYTMELTDWRDLYVLLTNKAVLVITIHPIDLEKAKQLASQAIKRLP